MTKMISRMMMLLAAGFLVAAPASAKCGMSHDGAAAHEHGAGCPMPCCAGKKDKGPCPMHADEAECEKAGCHKHGAATQNFGPKSRK